MSYHDPFLIELLVQELLPYLALGYSGFLAGRFVRTSRRAADRGEDSGSLQGRVQRLESSVEHVEWQLRESVEAQRFTTGILLARGSSGGEAGRD